MKNDERGPLELAAEMTAFARRVIADLAQARIVEAGNGISRIGISYNHDIAPLMRHSREEEGVTFIQRDEACHPAISASLKKAFAAIFKAVPQMEMTCGGSAAKPEISLSARLTPAALRHSIQNVDPVTLRAACLRALEDHFAARAQVNAGDLWKLPVAAAL